MPFLLIPNTVRSQEATIWVGIANQRMVDLSRITLTCNGQNIPLGRWESFATRSRSNVISYQSVKIPNLEPRTEYFLELFSDGEAKTFARVRALPNELPTLGEQPFNVLLGSCFCSSRSESITLGSTYLNLQRQQKTDIKILCGDQVYLDDPTLHFTWNRHSAEELEDLLTANYLRTWTQNGTFTGYQQFLQNGANFFSADDHEYWNNAPNWATAIPDTWTEEGRETWKNIAVSLFRMFQSDSTVTTFKVGSLSFFIADTRLERDANQHNFMSFEDLRALDDWVTSLEGVGALVIGQPVFSQKAGWRGKFFDRKLPDYVQYEEIVRILSKANHSILLLTGDVHYGRISHCLLKPPDVYLYEIISSPTALVNPLVGGSWKRAPDFFPDFNIPGVVPKAIENDFGYQFTQNHFLTLSFFQHGAKTRVIIKTVAISGNGHAPTPVQIADLTLS
jgi:hypothetical protein